MTKEFIPYEQALDLKELGFNEECFKFYYKKNKKLHKKYEECKNFWSDSELIEQGWKQNEINEKRKSGEKFECCVGITAPLYQQAFRWFREKYLLFGYPFLNDYQNYGYRIVEMISDENKELVYDWGTKDTYEEAEQACLEQLIQIVNDDRRNS